MSDSQLNNLRKQLELFNYYDSLSRQVKHHNYLQKEELNQEKLTSILPSNQREFQNVKLHIPEQKIPQCQSKHESSFIDNNIAKDYMKINSRVDQFTQKAAQQKVQDIGKQVILNNKFEVKQLSKDVLNEYMQFVNKRSAFLNEISDSFGEIDQIQYETLKYLDKYYGPKSQFKELIEKTVDNLSSQNGFIKQVAFGNQKIIQRKLQQFKLLQVPEVVTAPQSTKIKNKSRLHQFQEMFLTRSTSQLRKKSEYFKSTQAISRRSSAQIGDDMAKKLDDQIKLKQRQKNIQLDYEYRNQGLEKFKKELYEQDMKEISSNMLQNILSLAMDKDKQQKKKNIRSFNIKNYIKKMNEYDHLFNTYRDRIKSRQFSEAKQLQQIFQAKGKIQQQNIRDLINFQKDEDKYTSQEDLMENLVGMSNRKLSCDLKKMNLSNLLSKSNSLKNSNKRFLKSLNSSLKKNQKGYNILQKKFKNFQDQCEMGDDLDALKL